MAYKTVALIFIVLTLAGSALSQQKPEYDMGMMQMVLLSRSPEWKDAGRSEELGKEHKVYVLNLVKEGRLALWGEVTGEGELREVMVFRTDSIEEARSAARLLPAVKAGWLKPLALTWYTARNLIKERQFPLTQSDYIFGILVRGPKWTKEETAETKKIQEGHLANINRLAEAGKLLLAGPFEDGGDRRGVFIFKVGSVEEAQVLTDTDPAVIAGRLKIELHRWSVPKGMLP
jgi:uncharacterized protein YciI